MAKISKIIRNCMLVAVPVTCLMAPWARVGNYWKNVNPFAAKLCEKVINEGLEYHTDRETKTRHYFKKMREGFFDGRVYLTLIDKKPYGPSNNDELTVDQELGLYFSGGRFIKITDKGLDLIVDKCEGECGGGLEKDFPTTVKDLIR